jgi:acyl carrier protein
MGSGNSSTVLRPNGTFRKGNRMEDMHAVVRGYIAHEYVSDGTEITNDTPLISGGLVDSFSIVSLKGFLEKTYKIRIPDDKATAEAFDTVDRIVSLLKQYVQG